MCTDIGVRCQQKTPLLTLVKARNASTMWRFVMITAHVNLSYASITPIWEVYPSYTILDTDNELGCTGYPAGNHAFFGVRYLAGYPVSFAGYRISGSSIHKIVYIVSNDNYFVNLKKRKFKEWKG